MPFEVPSSWVWCELGSVNEIARGGSPRPIKDYLTDATNGINWIKIGDTKKDGKYIDSVKEKIIPEGVKKSRMVHKGDFLLTNSMSFGRPYILNVDGCIHDGWLVISPLGKVYTSDFLYYLLSSSFAFEQFTNVASGGVVTNLNSDKVASTKFPLPPYEEQKRIVLEIEHWFALIDIIEHSKVNLQANIKFAKTKVLDLAIHGKLVPQDPTDEPASELLKRINPKAEITSDNGHYQKLPEGWVITPMQTLCALVDGEKQNGIERINLDVKYLRGEREAKVLTSGKYTAANTLLILVDGENSGEVFRAPVDGYQGSTFKQLSIHEEMYTDYVLQVINLHRKTLRENKVGSAIPHLNKKLFKAINVPIPPYEEQKRIVNAINKTFTILDKIAVNL
ncbi:restriction endonuclease subunit S [Leyella stercorea]|uniref:restriction endonuclease subunit S n=1 Tax=Leyella stercorea TaxID=363265 RepID=UPI00242B54DD